MKIAVFSLEQAWENKKANRDRCRALLEKAEGSKPDLAVFPELTLTGFSMNTELAEQVDNSPGDLFGDSPSIEFFSGLARANETACLFGMMVRQNGRVFNSAVLLDKRGDLVARYDKIHPFSFSDEEKHYAAGNKPVAARLEGVGIGLSICYDLRFPELYQYLSAESQVLINIACWPKRRVMHWKTLLCARAIENLSFMIGVNCAGTDGNGIEYEKSSLVFNPGGTALLPEHSFAGCDVYSIDPQEADETRSSFPAKQDRKPQLYKTFY